MVSPEVVETVARDFDLQDGGTAPPVLPSAEGREKFDVVEALRMLATLADRLRTNEQDLPKERKL
jgi:hypothetical protein